MGGMAPVNASLQTLRDGFDVDASQLLQVGAHCSTSSPQRHVGGSVLVHAAESQHSHGLQMGPGSPTYWSWQTWRDGSAMDGPQDLQVEGQSKTWSMQLQIGGMDLVHTAWSQHFHGLFLAAMAASSASPSPQLSSFSWPPAAMSL